MGNFSDDPRLEAARHEWDEGHHATAREWLMPYLRENPGSTIAKLLLADCLRSLHCFAEAEALFAGLRKNHHPEVQKTVELFWGQLLTKQGKWVEAIEHFRRAADLAPDSTGPRVFLADCLTKLERCDEALAILESALELHPDPDEVCLNVALIHRSKRRYEEAMTYCDRALALSPDFTEASKLRADLEALFASKSQREGPSAEANPSLAGA